MKRTSIYSHICAFLVICLLHVLIYATGQHIYRSSANEPQWQLANSFAQKLSSGKPLPAYFSSDVVELDKTLEPFVILYDASKTPVKTTVSLNGKTPTLPPSVFEEAARQGSNVLTWQPQHGLREALVVLYAPHSNTPYVVVGRSLRYTEEQTEQHMKMVFISWILSIIILGIHWVLTNKPSIK